MAFKARQLSQTQQGVNVDFFKGGSEGGETLRTEPWGTPTCRGRGETREGDLKGAASEVGGEPSKCVVFWKPREESISRRRKYPAISHASERSLNMSSEKWPLNEAIWKSLGNPYKNDFDGRYGAKAWLGFKRKGEGREWRQHRGATGVTINIKMKSRNFCCCC